MSLSAELYDKGEHELMSEPDIESDEASLQSAPQHGCLCPCADGAARPGILAWSQDYSGIYYTAEGDSCTLMQEGQHADASEQTGQMANGTSSSPCESMQESVEMDDLRADGGSHSSQAVDPDTEVTKK